VPKFSLIPKEVKFYDLFEKATENLVQAAKELADLLKNYKNVKIKVKHIGELEHEGDSITHGIMEKLHSTFVTPLDREDIAQLTNKLDDMLDLIEAGANAMILYNVSKPTECSQHVADIIVDMAERLYRAMPMIRQKKLMKRILEECVEINRLENEADQHFREAITDLFAAADPDPIETIKWREIYEILEAATDRGEDAANALEGIVLKYA
jgi:predicted phosphate transport protein (TIGR00153 family)